MSLLLFMAFTAGCSQNELKLLEAIVNPEPVYSYESSGHVEFSFNVENVNRPAASDYYDNYMSTIIRVLEAYFDGAGFDYSAKLSAEKDYSSIREEFIITPSLLGGQLTSLKTGLWLDYQGSDPGKTDVYIQMPKILAALTEETAGKDYLTMDLNRVLELIDDEMDLYTGAPLSEMLDIGKLVNDSNGLSKTFADGFKQMAAQMKPDEVYVRDVRPVPGSNGKMGRVYTLSITDSGLKKLVRSFVNDLDKDTLKGFTLVALDGMIEYYSKAAFSSVLYGDVIKELKSMKKTVETEFDLGYVFIKPMVNDILDKMNNVRLLGPKGITFDIEVDSNGFVTAWDGVLDFSIDVARIEKLTDSYPSGMKYINFTIKANETMTRINQRVFVDMPETTSINSVSLESIIEKMLPEMTDYIDWASL